MVAFKHIKLAEKSAGQQQQIVADLNAVVKDIERSERMITDLKTELEAVNAKHQGRRTTREDIAYLSALLECAKKKLAWEKQIASLQKRVPLLLEQMTVVMNDAKYPPAEQTRNEMLQALQRVQSAMERLQTVEIR